MSVVRMIQAALNGMVSMVRGGQNVPGFCEMKRMAYVWTYLKSEVSEFDPEFI